jgi:hypothetical protein
MLILTVPGATIMFAASLSEPSFLASELATLLCFSYTLRYLSRPRLVSRILPTGVQRDSALSLL